MIALEEMMPVSMEVPVLMLCKIFPVHVILDSQADTVNMTSMSVTSTSLRSLFVKLVSASTKSVASFVSVENMVSPFVAVVIIILRDSARYSLFFVLFPHMTMNDN